MSSLIILGSTSLKFSFHFRRIDVLYVIVSCSNSKSSLDSRMFVQSQMITILLIIVHGCIAVVEEFENCNRVQFSFNDQTGTNSIQNFTKQSFNKNGKPEYYSVFGPKKKWRYSVIWWNNKINNWLSQTRSEAK